MILEEETYEKFGYYPNDLASQSNKPILTKCEDCGKIRELGKDFYRPLCRSCVRKGKRNHFFGKQHSIESKQKIRANQGDVSNENNPHWKGGGTKRICQQCGEEFKVPQAWIKKGAGKFCSRKCQGTFRSKNFRGENSPNWKGGEIERICLICGKRFTCKPVQIKNGGGKYCSRSCTRKARNFPKHHTKPELIFEQICKKNNLPFKYVGNGDFWIHNMNPDFIECNGKKVAIEIFGDYWHSPLLNYELNENRTLPYRKKMLKKYGWKLIMFWGTDLLRKDTELFILSKLKEHL